MKYLIIYSHPKGHESHNSTILKEVEEILSENKHSYEILDLYEMKYDPVLTADELYGAHPKRLGDEEKKIQDKIKDYDSLIFIYPIWWGTMPAILKGFIDRVFSSGFAFKYEGRLPKGLLKDKTAIVFATTGAPEFASYFISKNRFAKHMKNDILGFCGIKSKVYQIGNARKLTDSQKEKIRKTVRKALQ